MSKKEHLPAALDERLEVVVRGEFVDGQCIRDGQAGPMPAVVMETIRQHVRCGKYEHFAAEIFYGGDGEIEYVYMHHIPSSRRTLVYGKEGA